MNGDLQQIFSQDQIQQQVSIVAKEIEKDYQGKSLVVIAVLKGAICLVADLIRAMNCPLLLEVVQCSSYGAGGTKRGTLTIVGLERLRIEGKDVLVVDDIFDTGHTLQGLYDALIPLHPRSIKSCVLLEKNVPHVSSLKPDYPLFQIEDLFVVGYGLDYKELYRELPGVYRLFP